MSVYLQRLFFSGMREKTHNLTLANKSKPVGYFPLTWNHEICQEVRSHTTNKGI